VIDTRERVGRKMDCQAPLGCPTLGFFLISVAVGLADDGGVLAVSAEAKAMIEKPVDGFPSDGVSTTTILAR